jgi:hypothetical protein
MILVRIPTMVTVMITMCDIHDIDCHCHDTDYDFYDARIVMCRSGRYMNPVRITDLRQDNAD